MFLYRTRPNTCATCICDKNNPPTICCARNSLHLGVVLHRKVYFLHCVVFCIRGFFTSVSPSIVLSFFLSCFFFVSLVCVCLSLSLSLYLSLSLHLCSAPFLYLSLFILLRVPFSRFLLKVLLLGLLSLSLSTFCSLCLSLHVYVSASVCVSLFLSLSLSLSLSHSLSITSTYLPIYIHHIYGNALKNGPSIVFRM